MARDSSTSGGSLIRSTTIYAAFDLGVKLLHILVTVWLTHLLTQDQFGAYGLLMSLTALLGLLVTFGLHGSASRWYFDTDEARFRRLVFTIFVTVALGSLGLAVLLDQLGLRFFEYVLRDFEYLPIGRFTLIAAVGIGVTAIPVAILVARREPTRASLVNLCITFLPLAGVVFAVLSAPTQLENILLGYMIGAIACAIVGGVVTLRMASVGFELAELKRALMYGLPIVPHLLSHWVLSASDRYLIGRLRSTAEIAPYHLAYLFGYAVLLFGQSINKAWAPNYLVQLTKLEALGREEGERFRLLRRRGDGAPAAPTTEAGQLLWDTICRQCRGVAGVFVAAGAMVIIWGGEVVRPFLAPGYGGAVALVGPIVIGTLAMILYFIPVNTLFFHRRTKLIPVLSISAAVGNILLNLWWIPLWGALGAAVSTAAAYLVLLLLFTLVTRRISLLPLSWRHVLPLILMCLAALPAVWVDVAVSGVFARMGLKLVLTATLFGLCYRVGYLSEWLATLNRIRRRSR